MNLNLKDVVGPLVSSGSDDASNSSRPTTSTEDTNSDTGSHEKVVKRSKTLPKSNPPDLLPPPDGFDNTNYQHPIDTTTAKAIIDTYSGHLFSRSTNYFSFRGHPNATPQQRHPTSAVETLFTRDPTNFEQDSLDNSYYKQCTVVVPPRVKTRTESVV